MAKIVAITGCPAGVAHTYMAAEALKKTAAFMGHEIKVETHGAEGTREPLSARDVAEADVVIAASDVYIEMERFAGKPMVAVPVSDAIRKTRVVIENALAELKEEKELPVPAPASAPVPKRNLGSSWSASPPVPPASPTPSWPPKRSGNRPWPWATRSRSRPRARWERRTP